MRFYCESARAHAELLKRRISGAGNTVAALAAQAAFAAKAAAGMPADAPLGEALESVHGNAGQ